MKNFIAIILCAVSISLYAQPTKDEYGFADKSIPELAQFEYYRGVWNTKMAVVQQDGNFNAINNTAIVKGWFLEDHKTFQPLFATIGGFFSTDLRPFDTSTKERKALFLNASALKPQDNVRDKIEIEKVVLNYIENFFRNDYANMEKCLHDRLSKRGLDKQGMLSEDFSKDDLKALMNNKKALPATQQSNQVSEILIDRNFASAVLDTGYPSTRWKEYIHLAKIDGGWIIMDVFWNFY